MLKLWAETSFYGALFVLFILVVRRFVKYYGPPGFLTCMWCCAMIRFLVPVRYTNVLRIFTFPQLTHDSSAANYTQIGLHTANPSGSSAQLSILGTRDNFIIDIELLQFLWIFVAILMAVIIIAIWAYWYRIFAKAPITHRDSVAVWLRTNNISRRIIVKDYPGNMTPLTYGFFRPVILLPRSIKDEDISIIMLHEYTHIVRHDGFIKIISVLVVCLHWYNPFAWVLLTMISRDIEIDCDRMAINKMGQQSKKAYATTLLNAIESSIVTVLHPCHSKTDLHERMVVIMRTGKVGSRAFVLAGVVSLILISGLLTGAASPALNSPVYPQDSGGVVVDGDIEPVVDAKSYNRYGFEQLDIPVGEYMKSPIRVYNGDMCIFTDDGKGWRLSEGDTLAIELQTAQVEGYETKGQNAEIGYIHAGKMHELTDESIYKLKQTGTFSFTAPAEGDYYFYMINYCIDSMYLVGVSVN